MPRARSVPPTVVLVRPSEQGNVGATARAMANMGLADLVVVEPAAPFGEVARAFAVGARGILDRARRVESLDETLAPFQRVVGTTSVRGRASGPPPLSPRELAATLAAEAPATRIALVFGPERSGLSRDELALCGLLVNVPCAPRHPTLNLAQAVLVVAYELHLARGASPAAAGPATRATHAAVEGLFAHGAEILERVGFNRDATYEQVLRDLRQLAARAALTEREVTLLRGIWRRVGRSVR